MIERRDIMGMPVVVDIVGAPDTSAHEAAFEYLRTIDSIFSTYKSDSEISRINRGEIAAADFSPLMQEVFELSAQTKRDAKGYFDIEKDHMIDPSGLVKGWAIRNAAQIIRDLGHQNFYLEIGGDIEAHGMNNDGMLWKIGIRNPFKLDEIVKIVNLSNKGIATSGKYLRGEHIYNPHDPADPLADIASMTIIADDVYEADRYATAAFSMGRDGIVFVESIPGLEGYSIDKDGVATMTTGFDSYVLHA